jgi:hypothetical protein
MEPIVNDDVKRDIVEVAPKEADGTRIPLIRPKRTDAILFKEDISIDVSAVYTCTGEIGSPST